MSETKEEASKTSTKTKSTSSTSSSSSSSSSSPSEEENGRKNEVIERVLAGRTHYEVLGVARNASQEQISKSYKESIKLTHPDHGGSGEAFTKVHEANRVLKDPQTRAAYNLILDKEQLRLHQQWIQFQKIKKQQSPKQSKRRKSQNAALSATVMKTAEQSPIIEPWFEEDEEDEVKPQKQDTQRNNRRRKLKVRLPFVIIEPLGIVPSKAAYESCLKHIKTFELQQQQQQHQQKRKIRRPYVVSLDSSSSSGGESEDEIIECTLSTTQTTNKQTNDSESDNEQQPTQQYKHLRKTTSSKMTLTVAQITDKEVGKLLANDWPKYGIDFRFRDQVPDEFFTKAQAEKQVSFPLVYSDGAKYDCFIPNPSSTPTEQEKLPQKHEEEEPKSEEEQLKEIHKLLKPLTQLCLHLKGNGWWTYEYCRGGHVSQYHEDPKTNERSTINILGVAPESLEESGLKTPSAIKKDRKEKVIKGEAFVEVYEDGDICDVTHKPRTVEIRFECNSIFNGLGALVSVTETSTCNYKAHVKTALLCNHPAFRGSSFKTLQQEREQLENVPKIICITDRPEGFEQGQCTISEGESLANNEGVFDDDDDDDEHELKIDVSKLNENMDQEIILTKEDLKDSIVLKKAFEMLKRVVAQQNQQPNQHQEH